jgi:hypothetical protein
MESVSSSILMAAALTGMLAIPVASDAEPTDTINSEGSDAPVEMMTRSSADGFVRTVSTAFDRFKINITGNHSHSILETPESRIETFQRPGKTERVLETSKGTYRVIEASDRRVVETDVPEGKLVERIEDGAKTTSFEGVNRSRVEELKDGLEERYSNEIESLESRYRDMSSDSRPDVEVDVQPESIGDGEYVELENQGDKAYNLEDWRIEDEDDNEYIFDDVELETGESLRVYSSNESKEFTWGTSYVWQDNGDTAYLYDSDDILVSEHSY